MKLNSANAQYHSEKKSWEINLQNLEETWRCIESCKVFFFVFLYCFLGFFQLLSQWLRFDIRICSNLNHTVRCEALKAQKEVKEVIPDPDMQIELEDLKQRYKKLKV